MILHPGPERDRDPARKAHERKRTRPRRAEDRARDDQVSAFPKDEPQDMGALGTEPQPDSDLAPLAGDRIGRDAGQADGGEHETEETQAGELCDSDPDHPLDSLEVLVHRTGASKIVSRRESASTRRGRRPSGGVRDLPRTRTVVPWTEALRKRVTGIGANAVATGVFGVMLSSPGLTSGTTPTTT